jgi:hypothetical protein
MTGAQIAATLTTAAKPTMMERMLESLFLLQGTMTPAEAVSQQILAATARFRFRVPEASGRRRHPTQSNQN